MRFLPDIAAFEVARRRLNFDNFIEDPRGCVEGMIKLMFGHPDQTAVGKLFGSITDIDTQTIYDIVLRIYSDTSALPWTSAAVADHLRGLVDTERRASVTRAKLQLLELDDTPEEVAAELVLFASMAPDAARAALDGRIGRAIDLLPELINDEAPLDRREILDLLAKVSRFWIANDLRLTHRYILRRAAAPFGDRILDKRGGHLTKQYALFRPLVLRIVRRTLRTYLNGSDNQLHRGPLTVLLRPLRKRGERLLEHWSERYGNDLDARLRAAIGTALLMLDELQQDLKLFAEAKNARGKSKLKQKPELRDDYDANLLLYLTSLFAVAWCQMKYDEDGKPTGSGPLEQALKARQGASPAGATVTACTPPPVPRHFMAARKLVAIARWADGDDKPALPISLRTRIAEGVKNLIKSKAKVKKLPATAYTLDELVSGILKEDRARDSSASRGAKSLLDASNPRTPGQQWMHDFAEGSLAWRINDR